MDIEIVCTINDECIYRGPAWGATDALVNYYCDNSTPNEIYEACCALGDAITKNEYYGAYEAFLACDVQSV